MQNLAVDKFRPALAWNDSRLMFGIWLFSVVSDKNYFSEKFHGRKLEGSAILKALNNTSYYRHYLRNKEVIYFIHFIR